MIDGFSKEAVGLTPIVVYMNQGTEPVMVNLLNVANRTAGQVVCELKKGTTLVYPAWTLPANEAQSFDGVLALLPGEDLTLTVDTDLAVDVIGSVTGEN